MKKIYTLLLIFSSFFMFGQVPANDDCTTAQAITIPASGNICITSSNLNATNNGTTTTCDTGAPGAEVWFSYIAAGSVNTVTVTPSGGAAAGSAMVVTIKTSPCATNTNSGCNAATGAATASVSTGLVIGQQVWISVTTNGTNGQFDLCVSSTTPPPLPGESCATATKYCTKEDFTYSSFAGVTPSGINPSCFASPGQKDVWIKFTVGVTGTLEFVASPNGAAEYDWALFDITSGCLGVEKACNYNTATDILGCNVSSSPMGISSTPGIYACPGEFNAPFTVVAGNTYAIMIDNFTANNVGFDFEWGGTFQMSPTASFTATPTISCATPLVVNITNTSAGATTNNWNFGDGTTFVGANPPPHTYNASGTYFITLVTTGGGCTDSYTLPISVNTPNLSVSPTATTICAGDPAVTLTATASAFPTTYPQTFTNTTDVVISTAAGATSNITTLGLNTALTAGMISSVCMNIQHTDNNNLDVTLIAPDNSTMILSTDKGGTGNGYVNACFVPTGGAVLPTTNVTVTGNYTPQGVFTSLTGNPNGVWKLQVVDDTSAFNGTILDWTINFVVNNMIVSYSWSPATGLTSTGTTSTTNIPSDSTDASPATTTTYTVVATDFKGCTNTKTVIVTVGGATAIASTIVNTSCGGSNGSITLGAVTGGVAPYTYSFNASPFTATTSYPGLTAGSYAIIVKDVNGCNYNTTLTVIDNPGPTALAATVVNSNCAAADGSITLGAVTGGTAAYTYSFNGSPFTATTNYPNLLAGSYTIIVKDANGCTFTINPTVIDNPGPTGLAATVVNSNCGAADGSITLGAVTGGTAAYTYSFNGSPFTSTINYTGLLAGSYTVIVKDANGCTFTLPQTIIDNPGPTALAATVVNSNCGAADGSITLGAVTGGTPAYTYSFNGSPFTATTSYPNLLAGSYTIIVKDSNGCTFTINPTVIDNPGPTGLAATVVNSSCGAADGSITLGAVTGGAAAYTYSFNGSPFTATTSYTGLLAGSYTIIVKDANGCTFTINPTVIDNAGITALATTTVNSNCGASDGSITIGAVTGGTAPYTYSFNGSPFTATTLYTGLIAGSYTIDVKDANGCLYNTSVTVIDNPGPTAVVLTTVNSNCGAADGSVTIGAVTGGTAPYTFSFNGGGFGATLTYTGLLAISYPVIVKDANGCTFNASVTVIDNPGPTAVVLTTVNSNCGAADGVVNIGAVTGGTAPYTYSFNGSAFTATLSYTGLIAGSYTVVVKDANGCIFNASATVIDNPGPTAIAMTTVDAACGASNGSVTLGAVTGGTAAYTYSFNGSPYTSTLTYSGLLAGSYTLDVKDANGCIYSTTVSISNVGGPTAIATTIVDAICGGSNGSVTLGAVTGGVAPYTYSFAGSPYTATLTYTGLIAGSYTIDVKDANGCIYSTSVTVIDIPSPTAIATTIVDETCGGANGSVTLGAVTGGVAPYTYSFNGSAYSGTTLYSGLIAGSYTIDVKDANGCIYSTSVTIVNAPGITAIATVIVDENCGAANGSVTLGAVTGGTGPYTYSFNGSPFTSTTVYSGLIAGSYTIDVEDANGCTYNTTVMVLNSGAPTAIATTIVNESCGAADGSVTLGAVTGGTAPYTYSFAGSAYTGTTVYSNLIAGTYTLNVKDANGCVYPTTVTITNSASITAIATTLVNETCGAADGSVTLGAVTGGTAPYTYSFAGSPYTGTTLYSSLVAGTYTIDVKDVNGCIYSTTVTLINSPAITNVVTTLVNEGCTSANGSVTIGTVTGGTAPYTYSFNGSAYSGTTLYSNLVAGSYTIDVKDANGCLYNTTVTITNTPGPTAIAMTITNAACGASDGSVSLGAVTGGTAPYTYSFNGSGYTGSTLYGSLAAGSYTLDVKDANGCIYSTIISISNTGGPTAIASTSVNEACGSSNGSVTLGSVTGGTAPYTYSFNGSAYTGTTLYSGLAAGIYSIDVKDASGCIYSTSVTLTNAPGATAIAATVVDSTCGASNGSITLGAVTGGTAPYTYSFNSSAYTATTTYSGLAAGTYTIDVKDANGCIYSTSITLTTTVAPTAAISYAGTPFCNLTTTPQPATLTGTGVYTGGTYASTPGLTIAANGDITPSSSTPGTYTVTYTIPPTGGCPAITATTSVTIDPALSPTISCGTPTTTSVQFNWTAVTGATGYSVSYQINSGTATTVTPIGNVLTYPVTGLAPADTVTIFVTPTGAGACLTFSSQTCTASNCPPATANISYATPFCISNTPQSVTLTGTGTYMGGIYSSTGGLPINAATGDITPNIAGTYTVNYFMASSGGCPSVSASTSVTINALPVAMATPSSQAICSGSTTNIALSSSINPGTTYNWTVVQSGVTGATNGSGANIAQTLTATGTTAGTATYDIIPTANGCSGSPITVVITVNAAPVATATPASQAICSGQSTGITLTSNLPGTTYSWTFTQSGANGASNGTGNIISQVLTATGSGLGTVIYTITPTGNGCVGLPITVTVTVAPPPTATATATPSAICSGDTTNIVLTGSIPGTIFTWNVVQTNVTGGTNGTGNVIAQTLNTVGTNAGEAVYVITPTMNGCPGTPVTVSIIVKPNPTVTANPTMEILCSGETTGISLSSNVPGTTFSWTAIASFGISGANAGTGNLIAQTLSISGTNQGTVDYEITPIANGCPGAKITVTVTVKPRPEVFGSPVATICSGDTTTISLTPSIPGATTFAWTVVQSGVSGATSGTGSSINQVLETTGSVAGTATYTVTPTANGCDGDPIDIVVTVNPLPAPTLTDGIICVDAAGNSFTTYTLDTGLSNSAYDFVWYLDNVIVPGAVNSTHDASLSGNYTVQVTNTTTGCVSPAGSGSVSATITESYPGTDMTLTASDAFTYNPTITVDVTPTPNPNYLYSLDDGPLQESNIFSPVSPGNHTVKVTDINGCTDLEEDVFVIGYPHFFTPNGDGVNDTWNIVGLNDPSTKIYIFDRYGKLVKQISPTGAGWDGTYNGEILPSTDYWFTIDYVENGGTKLFKAHFSMKR